MVGRELGNQPQPHTVHKHKDSVRRRQVDRTTPSCSCALVAWVHAAGRPLFSERDKQKRAAVQILSWQSLCVQLGNLTLAGGRRREEKKISEQQKKKKRRKKKIRTSLPKGEIIIILHFY
jgi:hypothetical protein